MKSYFNVKIEYEGGGSGYGQEVFFKGFIYIGRIDLFVKELIWKKFFVIGDQFFQFFEIVGVVVVVFNVLGVDELKFDGEIFVKIFMGEIEYWDDDVIKVFNFSVNFLYEKIIVVYRSDLSGIIVIFIIYLSFVNKEWVDKVGVGKIVDWFVDKVGRGIGGKGNFGVVQVFKNIKYSIVYIEFFFVIEENFKVVVFKNKVGNFVKFIDDVIKVVVVGVKVFILSLIEGYKEDFNQFFNVLGENFYLIVVFIYFFVWQNKGGKYYSKEEVQVIKEFFRWVLIEGQKLENFVFGYVGFLLEVVKIGFQVVDMIEG